jgi:tRNA(Glu) U13 pseudouridine synthase TruD
MGLFDKFKKVVSSISNRVSNFAESTAEITKHNMNASAESSKFSSNNTVLENVGHFFKALSHVFRSVVVGAKHDINFISDTITGTINFILGTKSSEKTGAETNELKETRNSKEPNKAVKEEARKIVSKIEEGTVKENEENKSHSPTTPPASLNKVHSR